MAMDLERSITVAMPSGLALKAIGLLGFPRELALAKRWQSVRPDIPRCFVCLSGTDWRDARSRTSPRDGCCRWGGSVAIALLDKLGYHVIASSRRAEEEADYLHGLGADEIIDARELSKTGSLLEQRALVRRSRFCRQPNTRKRTVADQIRWRGRPVVWHKVRTYRQRSCRSSCAT